MIDTLFDHSAPNAQPEDPADADAVRRSASSRRFTRSKSSTLVAAELLFEARLARKVGRLAENGGKNSRPLVWKLLLDGSFGCIEGNMSFY